MDHQATTTKEVLEKTIKHLQKNLVRNPTRKRERFLRKYGTDLPVIKAIMPFETGLAVAIEVNGGIKEIQVPLLDKIPNYKILFRNRKIKHLFHEDTLLVDIYTLGEGVLYTIELAEYIFDEML